MLQGDFNLPKPKKKSILALGFVGIAGLVGLAVTVAAAAFILSAWLGLPLNAFGLNEGPDQPIAFPHTVHVQKMGMDCTFCHRNVTKGAAASVPAVGLCMTCHKTMGSGLPEVEKLRDYHLSLIHI